ncbi:hypothetical protein [Celeribacter sp. ULVN23_4]
MPETENCEVAPRLREVAMITRISRKALLVQLSRLLAQDDAEDIRRSDEELKWLEDAFHDNG